MRKPSKVVPSGNSEGHEKKASSYARLTCCHCHNPHSLASSYYKRYTSPEDANDHSGIVAVCGNVWEDQPQGKKPCCRAKRHEKDN